MLSPLTWAFILYVSIGFYIMAEAIVTAWDWPEYETWIKVVGSTFVLLFWPLIFFI